MHVSPQLNLYFFKVLIFSLLFPSKIFIGIIHIDVDFHILLKEDAYSCLLLKIPWAKSTICTAALGNLSITAAQLPLLFLGIINYLLQGKYFPLSNMFSPFRLCIYKLLLSLLKLICKVTACFNNCFPVRLF